MRKYFVVGADGGVERVENPTGCGFGITEFLGPLIVSGLSSVGLGTAAGAGATAGLLGPATTAAVGSGLADATLGAGVGALTDPKNPLQGAGAGAITGGITGGLGPALGGALGIGTTAGDALAGTASGALGSAVTGGNPLTGAITGGVSGGLQGLSAPSATPGTAPTVAGAPAGPGAASVIAPPGTAPPVDPTATSIAGQLGIPSENGAVIPSTASTPTAIPAPASAPATSVAALTGASPAPAATATPAAPAQTSVDRLMADPSLGNAFGVVKSNPGQVLGALGMGYEIMNQGNIPGLSSLKGIASRESAQAGALESSLSTGQLPAGYQAAMNQAKEAAKAQLRSKYATLGMSGSTSEAQDLSQVDVNAVAQSAQIASSLFQAGMSESNLSNELLMQILGINQQQDAATGNAIANFAAAMGGTRI